MNVTFIGMAGAGKSYYGKKLAERLNLEWVDSDVLLSEAYGGRDIQSILDELGEEAYLREEARVCMEAAHGRDNVLFSPGGSTVYTPEWMDFMRGISKVIYLKVPYETVEARLQKVPPRAIIGLGRKTLRELYDERHPLYERNAHFIVERGTRSSEGYLKAMTDFLGVDSAGASATV